MLYSILLQTLLSLNPKVPRFASTVSTEITREARKHWKRNQDKSCSVCFQSYYIILFMGGGAVNGYKHDEYMYTVCR